MARQPKASDRARAEPDHFLKALGANIKQARLQAGLTGAQLAAAAGTTKTWVYAVEEGKQNVTIQGLRRLLAALGLGIHDVLPSGPDLTREADRMRRLHQTATVLILQLAPLLDELRDLQALTAPAAGPGQ